MRIEPWAVHRRVKVVVSVDSGIVMSIPAKKMTESISDGTAQAET